MSKYEIKIAKLEKKIAAFEEEVGDLEDENQALELALEEAVHEKDALIKYGFCDSKFISFRIETIRAIEYPLEQLHVKKNSILYDFRKSVSKKISTAIR